MRYGLQMGVIAVSMIVILWRVMGIPSEGEGEKELRSIRPPTASRAEGSSLQGELIQKRNEILRVASTDLGAALRLTKETKNSVEGRYLLDELIRCVGTFDAKTSVFCLNEISWEGFEITDLYLSEMWIDLADMEVSRELLKNWASEDGEQAYQWMIAHEELGEHSEFFTSELLVATWKNNESAAIDFASMLPREIRSTACQEMVRVMAAEDSEKAIEFLNSHFSSTGDIFLMGEVLNQMAEVDLDKAKNLYLEALRRIKGVPDEKSQLSLTDELTNDMLVGMLRADPVAAFEFARSIPGEAGEYALTGVVRQIAADDPQSALERLANIDIRETRLSCLEALASEWAKTNPKEAIEWFESTMAGGLHDRGAAFTTEEAVSAGTGIARGLSWMDLMAYEKWEKAMESGALKEAIQKRDSLDDIR